MESLYWSNNQHHPLEGNSLFMPLISSGNDILCNIGNNIGGNINISKDHLNPIKADDQQHIQKTDTFFKDAAPAMSLHHHHHHPSYYQQNGPSPILDSRATSLYNPGLEPGIVASGGSFGSLDGLLSASNSLTETTTSIEDDGISMIFSDCKSLLMNSSHKGEGKLMETDSRNSSQEHILVRSADKPRSDPINPNKRKRSSENLQIKSTVASKNTSFEHISSDHQNQKKPRKQKSLPEKVPIIPSSSSNINFQQPSSSASSGDHEPDTEAIAQMKEMIYRAAAFRPVDFGVEITEKPKRKNVKISNYPQTVAARQRRERISERIRVLQRLVPGGNKMDTASMLDEAANYLKFLRSWVKALESFGHKMDHHHHQSMINSFSAASSSSSAMNGADLNNLGFSVPFMNHSLTMQPQFSFLNPSSVHPSRS